MTIDRREAELRTTASGRRVAYHYADALDLMGVHGVRGTTPSAPPPANIA